MATSECLLGSANQCDFQLSKLPDISGGEYCKITLNTNKQALLTNLSKSELGPTQINDKPVVHLGISVLNYKDIFRIVFRWEYPDSRIPNFECGEQRPDCLSVSTQKESIEHKYFVDDKKVPKNQNKCVVLSIHVGNK